METDDSGYIYFVSVHLGKTLKPGKMGFVRCENEYRDLWSTWEICESGAGARAPLPPPEVKQLHSYQLSGDQYFLFVLELAKCGRSADEIETLVSRLFKLLPDDTAPTPEIHPVCAVPLKKQSS